MQRTTKSVLCILSLVIAIGLWLKATVIQVPSGTWAPAGNMAEARSGAASVLLQDGTILVTGGEGASGALASAEFFNAGSLSAASVMNVARSGHAAVVLKDGRVLVTGGKTSGGGVTNAAEVYSPAMNSWIVIGSMADARSGHTATLLKDGRVFLAGGEGSAGAVSTLEVFDPAAGTFTFAGTMSSSRKEHAAALLADGQVMIAGGSNGSVALATSEMFNSETGAVAAGPALSTSRAGASATTLLDGKVLLAGGNNGSADLATAEVYDPTTGVVSVLGSSLVAARRNHLAFLLPHNNHVLIVGGSSGGTALATTELFRPWDGNFYSTNSMSAGRAGASGSLLALDGLLLVAGGSGVAGSELYGFATVKTDKDDYAPGELVTITGSGWQPGETVSLFLHEIDNPDPHDDLTLTAVADASGRILNNQFAPDEHDVGVRFYLTATGANAQAQTTFTDGNLSSSINFAIGPTSVPPGGTLNWNVSAACVDGGGPNTCASEGFTNGGQVQDGYTVEIQQATNAAFTPNVVRATITTTAGGASGSFAASSTGGPYFYRARHPNQNLANSPALGNDLNSWQPQNSNPITVTLAAANTAPTAEANGPYSVNEGGSVVLSGSGSDPDAGQTLTYTWDLDNNGTFETAGQNPTFSAVGRDGASSQTVVLKVCDSGSPSLCHTDTSTVNILNAPPVANAGADQSGTEGSPITFTFSCTDAGTADTWTGSVNWGDGSPAQNLGAVTCNSGTFPAMHTYADDDGSPFTVTLTVTDDDGGSHSDTATATVANAPPVANAGADQSGTEGSPITFTFSCTDAGTADTWTGSVNWGDGSPAQNLGAVTCNSGTFPAMHTYADNVGSPFTVTLTVTDDDGGSHSDTATATVANAPPVANAGADQSGTEGSPITFTFSCTDAGTADTWTGSVNWGDGSPAQNLGAVTCNSGTFPAMHTYADNVGSPFTVTLTVTDDDGGSHSDTGAAIVANVPPILAPLGLSSAVITENGSATLGGMFTDPGVSDGHVVLINWGDGSPNTTINLSPGTLTFSALHQYLDDNPTATAADNYSISVTVTDKDGGSGSGGTSITVTNAPPEVGSINASPSLLALGSSTTITLNFSDVGTKDNHSCKFGWDAVGVPDTVVNLSGSGNTSCFAPQTYTVAGVYTVAVTVTDDDTGNATTKYEYVVVYDPSAGFVTGGGWIQSPAGAYVAGPTLEGKANFGFVSKYLKGSNVPTGETEFQLHFATFNFQSASYQWLVVSGARAQYKGSGKINGAGNYGFLLTATDGQVTGSGGVDKFRIKIWDIATSAIVYDNVPTATSDDIDAANPQSISGGSITIHAPKK